MDKIIINSKDLIDDNLNKIEKLFPSVITEEKVYDEIKKDYVLKKSINFDKLKQELSDVIVNEDKEYYELTWPGKRQATVTANIPTTKTLRPDEDDSLNFDTTENLYIEGDNLEVLKILQESYLGKVKMIYIDPPYNTGKDFIYKDNFKVSNKEQQLAIGAVDEEGNKLTDRFVQNNESNGSYHSDWLSMMYPRLKLARNLLTDDGVIFISIDDNEVDNLKKVCEEIFGENNTEVIIWKKKGGSGNTEKILGVLTEYIICIFKEKRPLCLNYRKLNREYRYKDAIGPYNLESIEKTNLGIYERKTMLFPIVNPNTGTKYYPSYNKRWTLGENTVQNLIKQNRIYFDEKNNIIRLIKREDDYDKSENVYLNLLVEHGSLATAKDEIENLLQNREIFDTPKPVELIKHLLKMGSKTDTLILDFFSGAATTAHATMQLNAEDGGNRKFIMVQLPEPCDDKSEAYKAGYKNICEIGKERIRRAGKKILEDNKDKEGIDKLDIGFRVFKVDESIYKNVDIEPSKTEQVNIDNLISNIKEDRTPLELLINVMLSFGLELSLPIEKQTVCDKNIFIINKGDETINTDLVACFDEDIDEKVVERIAELKPLRAVFRDSCFKSDDEKINVEETIKRISDSTTVWVL